MSVERDRANHGVGSSEVRSEKRGHDRQLGNSPTTTGNYRCVDHGGVVHGGDEAADGRDIAASVKDADRFSVILDRHYPAIYRYLARRVGREVADELAAETFLVAFRSRRRYDPDQPNARPWLYGIATRLLRRHWRDETRRLRSYAKLLQDELPPFDSIERAIDRVTAAEELPRLLEALSTLDQDYRDVVNLVSIEGLDYAQAAAALGVPVGTVRSRLSRARDKLRTLCSYEPAPVRLGGEA